MNDVRVGKLPMKMQHGDILQLGTRGPDIKCVIALVHLCYPSTEKTISLESLIDQLEKEENKTPDMEAKLKGFKDALEDKELLEVSTQEALALNPSALEFPESQQMCFVSDRNHTIYFFLKCNVFLPAVQCI